MTLVFKLRTEEWHHCLRFLFSYCEVWLVRIFWMPDESHRKRWEHTNSISVKQNGVKARKILLLLTRMSCSFLIYQLTFHVQNSCISNSPQKMSACSGTVGCLNTVFSSVDGGPAQPDCSQYPSKALQAPSLNMCRWTPNANHNSVLHSYPQIELEGLYSSFAKSLYPKWQSEKKAKFCIRLLD